MVCSNCRSCTCDHTCKIMQAFFWSPLTEDSWGHLHLLVTLPLPLSVLVSVNAWTFWTLNKPQQHPPCYDWQVLTSHEAVNQCEFCIVETTWNSNSSPSFSSSSLSFLLLPIFHTLHFCARYMINGGKRGNCSQSNYDKKTHTLNSWKGFSLIDLISTSLGLRLGTTCHLPHWRYQPLIVQFSCFCGSPRTPYEPFCVRFSTFKGMLLSIPWYLKILQPVRLLKTGTFVITQTKWDANGQNDTNKLSCIKLIFIKTCWQPLSIRFE